MWSAGRSAPSVQCCPRHADRRGWARARSRTSRSSGGRARPGSGTRGSGRGRSTRAQADRRPENHVLREWVAIGPPDHRWSDGRPSSVGSGPTSTRCAPDTAGSCCWQVNRGSASPGSPRRSPTRRRRAGPRWRGAASSRACAPAFWPWTQVMQSLIVTVPRRHGGRRPRSAGRRCQPARPGGAQPGPRFEPPPSLGPEFERFRLCDALTRSIRALAEGAAARRRARGSPLGRRVVNWRCSRSCPTRSSKLPVLLVATYRDVGARTTSTLGDTLVDLAQQPMVRRLDLAGLDVDDVRAPGRHGTFESDDELVRTVHRRTQGNPFFLVEILRLRSSGHGSEFGVLPAGVRDVVRQRVGLLPEPSVDVMVAAAVLGPGVRAADARGQPRAESAGRPCNVSSRQSTLGSSRRTRTRPGAMASRMRW